MNRTLPSSPLPFLRAHGAALFSLAYLLLLLPFLAKNRLLGLDESIYANVALAATRDGHGLRFYFEGSPFFEKPPLGIWLQALSMRLFGMGEWGVRLPSAMAAAAVLYFVWRLAARIGRNELAGFLTVGLLATSEHFLLFSRVASLDMMLTLCLMGSWWETLQAFENTGVEAERHLRRLGLWLAAGLLVKSFFALAFLLPALLAFTVSRGKHRPLGRSLILAGGPPLLALALWFAGYAAIYGKAFFTWELGSNLTFRLVTGDLGRLWRPADIEFHAWQLYAELARNGMAFIWPLLPMGLVAWGKEARTGLPRRQADAALLSGFTILVLYGFLVLVAIRPLINYLMPLTVLSVLALAALWRKPPCLKTSWVLAATFLLALANGFARHALTGEKLLAACILAFALWNVPGTKPHHLGRRLRLAAILLLLAGALWKAIPYTMHPPDPNGKWVAAVREHPPVRKGEILLFYGDPVEARVLRFYCDYDVRWTQETPLPRPREAMLFEYNQVVHFLPAMNDN